MATEADEEATRSQHKQQETVDDALADEQAEQPPSDAAPTADVSDVGLNQDHQHESDVSMAGKQTPSICEREGACSATSEEAAVGIAARAAIDPNDATDLEEATSTLPECVSDLFGDCATTNLQVPSAPSGCGQVGGENGLGDQGEDSPRLEDEREQQQGADPTEAELLSLEQDESRVDPEHAEPEQTSERLHDHASFPDNSETLQAPDASMEGNDAEASHQDPSSTHSTKISEAPTTADANSNTQAANTVGSKRAAPSPTSTLPSFSWNDILRVQNLIERCLQQYLSKREILQALQAQASVDPAFANVVWQKLEEQNPSFFRAYHIQLRLKEQIVAFNYLVAQQKEMGAKRVKRRHVRTSHPAPASARRRESSGGGIFSPMSMLRATEALFSSAEDGSEPGQGDGMSASTANSLIAQLPPPSPLPLPSPIKTELDTHAFFT